MLLKPGHYYRDASGTIYQVHLLAGLFMDSNKSYSWNKDGTSLYNSKWNLVSEVAVTDIKPVHHVRYFNIYRNFIGYYKTKEEADKKSAPDSRLACVRVEYEEGQFDD
jgi:hypothetical protein